MANKAAHPYSPQTSATPLAPPDAQTTRKTNRSPAVTPRCGIGLINFFAAAAVPRSNFPNCAAVARAARKASPSPTTWLTSPICCALVALKLRPVSNRSLTTALPKSRFSRGIPPKPGISPSRNSGKQNRAILSAIIKSQASASSNPPPNVTPCTAAIVVKGAASIRFNTR